MIQMFDSEEELRGNKNGKGCFTDFQMLAQMKPNNQSRNKSKKELRFPLKS
jgi:hypothetical protein